MVRHAMQSWSAWSHGVSGAACHAELECLESCSQWCGMPCRVGVPEVMESVVRHAMQSWSAWSHGVNGAACHAELECLESCSQWCGMPCRVGVPGVM